MTELQPVVNNSDEARQLTVVKPQNTSLLKPSNLTEAVKFAELMANSDLVPQDFKGKPGNVLVAVQMGAEVGLSPMQAIQNIAVINGRPCMWGDALIGIVQASGKLKWIKEWEDNGTAYCETQRVGYPNSYKTSFSQEDAKKAGLLGKSGPWGSYPKRMCQMRARAYNLRDQFADVLKGLNVAEEVQDYTTNEEPKEEVSEYLPQKIEETSQEVKEEKSEFINEEQRKHLFSGLGVLKVPQEHFKKYLSDNFNIKSTSQIKSEDFETICEWVATREGANK